MPPGSRAIGRAPANEKIDVTIVVYKTALMEASGRRAVAPAAMRALRNFARANNLHIARDRVSVRNLSFNGTSGDFCKAFGIVRTKYASPYGEFYAYPGQLRIPRTLAQIIEGAIGLSQYPVRRISGHPVQRGRAQSFHPVQMSRLYNFPKECDGHGERVALIELGGGFRIKELRKFFRDEKLRMPKITVVSVDGVRNSPRASGQSVDLEVQGDIETLGSVAPGAGIIVYFAPSTERGLYDAVVKAVHDKKNRPTIISISFGEVEVFWAPRTLKILDEVLRDAGLLGITVCCAAGDMGSSGGVQGGRPHVYFPASSPHVLACGGTELKTKDGRIIDERVWAAGHGATTGGGVSRIFARPPYQSGVKVPPSPNRKLKHGRGLPDVSANAAGYRLVANGKSIVIGGTSAVAPLWAGLIARINEKRTHPVGFINPLLYGMYEALLDLGAMRPITRGSNGAYRARNGWNACAGLGSPDGSRLALHLSPER